MSALDPRSLDADAFHGLLANSRRRHLLAHLRETGQSTVTECARAIAARERNPSLADAEARKRVELALVHDHLPRLADHGIVRYDAARREVTAVNAFDELAEAVEVDATPND